MIVKDGWLVMNPKDPIALRSVIPHAKHISVKGRELTAVSHDLDVVQVLRNMGVNAPSPVNYGWKYPGRYTPYTHQMDTVDFLTVNRRAFVLNGLGSGKSCSAIWAAEYLMQQGLIQRVLVVAPRSCLHKVWGDELFRTTMHRTVAILQGTRGKRRQLFKSSATWLVINHDGLSTIADLVTKDTSVNLIIVDECSAFRNGTTNKYRTLKSCLRPDTRLWMMSGAPCPNAPTDAWAQARLVKPETVPPYFSAFKRATMDKISMFKWIPSRGSDAMVHKALQPAIRYATQKCIELPPVIYQNRECELTAEQRKLFKEMRKHMQTTHEGGLITAANAAVKLIKLLQICCGVIYDNDGVPRVSLARSRIEALEEIITESERKVIVWVPFKSVLYHLVSEINTRFGRDDYAKGVSGDTTDRQRTDIFTNFQDDYHPLRVLVAHPGTAAHGLTLVSANTSVWYAPFFSAEQYMQANARINRPGQNHKMNVVHLGATALEWGVYNVIKTKNNRQQQILDLYKNEILDI